ncbi:carbamoyltransferase C-terminal domain-containing protein [Nocardiopsis dassonvillei]|uniref:carbamoyltransferase C-terminal domain-containing protein n=1 Tax=Nocardiopsis dassonvillei TaxID=2014 RepID=UPI003670E497
MSNHDRSACLIIDGHIVGAVPEERLDRRKGSEGFYRKDGRGQVIPPMRAITRLLRDHGIGLSDLDLVVCGRSITTCREQFLDHFPIEPERVVEPEMPNHHLAHAYSAYATTPHTRTAVLVIDEQGSWQDDRFERCTWFQGTGGPLIPHRRFWGDHSDLSLGMFYNVFAALTGLSEGGRPAAGKLMSLAALGESHPGWPDLLELHEDGDVGCDLKQLDRFLEDAGVPLREFGSKTVVSELDALLTKYSVVNWSSQLGRDLAAKAQGELEKGILHTAAKLRSESSTDVLAYAGGVALNCVTNAQLHRVGWRDVHVHPAATDDGTSVGLAAYGWSEVLGNSLPRTREFRVFLGPRHRKETVKAALGDYGLTEFGQDATDPAVVAELVHDGAIVCWFSGPSEWGPRALGARSIVANPLVDGITDRINATIKYREPFRPFGISITEDGADELLELSSGNRSLRRYMLSLGKALHPDLRGVCHDDGSVRFQMVNQKQQPEWHRLIASFGRLSGLGAVINTSFNTFGEPLVESPDDAVRQFLLCGADALWIDGTLVVTADIPDYEAEAGRSRAWRESRLNPLSLALKLEDSGYPDRAQQILREHVDVGSAVEQYDPPHGMAYHLLRARIAMASGATDEAERHAAQVLANWWFPPEVIEAGAIAGQTSSGNLGTIGTLLTTLARSRSGLDFFGSLVPNEPRTGQAV